GFSNSIRGAKRFTASKALGNSDNDISCHARNMARGGTGFHQSRHPATTPAGSNRSSHGGSVRASAFSPVCFRALSPRQSRALNSSLLGTRHTGTLNNVGAVASTLNWGVSGLFQNWGVAAPFSEKPVDGLFVRRNPLLPSGIVPSGRRGDRQHCAGRAVRSASRRAVKSQSGASCLGTSTTICGPPLDSGLGASGVLS